MLLAIDNLTVRYDGAKIIKEISMHVNLGEIITLIGNNGAGKTTILRAISGLISIDNGDIYFDNELLNNIKAQDIVRKGLLQVPESRGLFPHMSVYENLLLGAFTRNARNEIIKDIGNVFNHFPRLNERSKQKAETLSGGEQQMLAIACGLMANPKLLLLDEPSIGLSPLMVQEISNIVCDINQKGTSVLLVEQNAKLALEIADRCYVLETGKIVLSGNSEELMQSEEIKKAYLS